MSVLLRSQLETNALVLERSLSSYTHTQSTVVTGNIGGVDKCIATEEFSDSNHID